jgi:glycosyltransferase involved in cell wall biosynthesis
MGPISVLHLVPEMALGGTERVLLDLLPRLDRHLFEMRVLVTGVDPVPEARRAFESLGLRTTHLPVAFEAGPGGMRARAAARLHAVRRLRDHLRTVQPHIVHTHGGPNNTWGSIAARLASVPHIMIHDHAALTQGRGMGPLQRYCARLADIAFVSSPSLGEVRRTVVRTGSERILQLPDGVDLQHFRPATAGQRSAARAELDIPPDALVVGAVGRLIAAKRFDLLLDSLPAIRAQIPRALLLLAGEGPERAALLQRARRLGLEASVRLPGWRPEILPAFHALDLFVMPGQGPDGSGRPLAEALGCGLPVLALRHPLVQHLDGGAVRLVEARVEALARAVVEVCRSDHERSLRGAAARRHAVAHFDIDRGARLLETVYAHCVARTPRPRPALAARFGT